VVLGQSCKVSTTSAAMQYHACVSSNSGAASCTAITAPTRTQAVTEFIDLFNDSRAKAVCNLQSALA